MIKRFENQLSMFNAVKRVCELNITDISVNAGLLNTYHHYLALLDDLMDTAREQTINRTGITIDKRHAREQLALLLESASGIIRAHFDSVRNFDIYNSVDKSLTRLRRMRDQLVIVHAQYILRVLTDHQADLAPFGVDAAYLIHFANILSQYDDIAAKPTLERNYKSTATGQLAEKVKKTSVFLHNELDAAMLVMKQDHVPFYLTYRHARRIVQNGIRHQEVLPEGLAEMELLTG